MDGKLAAMERKRLEELAAKPNTTVFEVKHEQKNEPWPVARLRAVLERIMERGCAEDAEADDFRFRKACMEDPETLAFQRQHPKMFWLVSDRSVMKHKKSRDAITSMLVVRERVENGEVVGEHEADAMATKFVMAALRG